MTRLDLDALEQVAKTATQGEWSVGADRFDIGVVDITTPQPGWTAHWIASTIPKSVGKDASYRNGKYIAAFCPPVALELIAELRRLRGIVGDLAKAPPVLQRTLPPPVVGESPLTTIECGFCHARDAIDGRVIVHAESCPYRRAVEEQGK